MFLMVLNGVAYSLVAILKWTIEFMFKLFELTT